MSNKTFLANKLRHEMNPLNRVYCSMKKFGFEKDTSIFIAKIYGKYFYKIFEQYFLSKLSYYEPRFRYNFRNLFIAPIEGFKESIKKNFNFN